MIKRALFILVALIPCLTFAQRDLGEWKSYSRYTKVTQMEQTSDKIYFLSGNSLYSYDKNTNESYTYSSLNKLSDNTITNIYYNNNGKYLLIAYQTGNIDLLYDDGKVVNISNIKDAVLTFPPNIVDVAFSGEYIYIATKFGLVVYDESKQKVKTTGIYNKEISFVTCVGDYIVVDQNHALYYIHKDGDFNSFNNFTQISSGYWMLDMEGLNNNMLLFRTTGKSIYIFELNFSNNSYKRINLAETTNTSLLIKGKDEYYYLADNILYSVNKEGVKSTHSTMPSTLVSQVLSIWDNPNDIWAGDGNGIANYNIASGNADVVIDKTKPTSFTVDYPFHITSDANGKVYVSNHGESRYVTTFKGNNWWFSYINTIENGKVENITPSGLESVNSASPNYQRKDGKPYSSYNIVFDPEDPETYYLSTYFDGIYKIKDGKQVAHYHEGNSTLLAIYGCRVFGIAFDKENNLWCVNEVNAGKGSPALHILPAEARKKETTTKEDWISIDLNPFIGSRDVRLLICKKSNMIFICDGIWSGYVVAYDTKGTYADTSDDTYYLWDYFVDQDGQVFDPYQYSSLAEDENGRVWIGTTNGVLEITDPSKATDPSMTVKRLKLKNESGIGYSGYLADALTVLSISVDENNNKWLATTSNGVYHVDQNGEKIYNHFTSDNSMLPPGIAYSVYVHPTTKSVFMGTASGLVEYNSSSSASKENYNDVYAYPNPVNPDYTGWITINGLMQNSNVKIVDANGNICFTCASQGGKVTWDGCDMNGNRVKAGVYYVYASQGDVNAETSPVTKIMVVK